METKTIGKEVPISEFCETLASKLPAPGGGGAAALCAALGTCLMNMVGNLTIGKKKYIEYEPEILGLMDECASLSARFLDLIEKDAEGFLPLAAAYAIPKDDPERAFVMESAIHAALKAPMEMLELLDQASCMLETFLIKGSRLALSDVGCAATLIRSAAEAAILNIFINTKTLNDRESACAINRSATDLTEKVSARSEKVYGSVSEQLKGESCV